MRVGIVTFHNADNYGAILQCVALKTVVSKLGYDCEVIDHINPAIESFFRTRWSSTFVGFKHKPISTLIKSPFRLMLLFANHIRHNIFQHDVKKYCEPKAIEEISPSVIIFGSDQIWNCRITNNDLFYWGKLDSDYNGKKISYAASIGSGPSENLELNKSLLLNFSKLSVREQSLYQLLSKIGISSELTIDPTLLLSSTEWTNLLKLDKTRIKKQYILVYCIRDKDRTIAFAKRMGDKLGLQIKNINSKESFDIHSLFNFKGGYASIRDYVSMIRDASLVITDSFHGTAFSVIFEKPFFSLCLGNKGDDRPRSLLKQLDLSENFVSADENINVILKNPNYSEKLDILKRKSLKYLENSLIY